MSDQYERKVKVIRSLSDSAHASAGGVQGLRWNRLDTPIAYSHLTPRFYIPSVLQLRHGLEPFTANDVRWGLFNITDRVVDYHRYEPGQDWKEFANGRNVRMGLLAHAAALLFATDGHWMDAARPGHACAIFKMSSFRRPSSSV
jgi:hypothetical protein